MYVLGSFCICMYVCKTLSTWFFDGGENCYIYRTRYISFKNINSRKGAGYEIIIINNICKSFSHSVLMSSVVHFVHVYHILSSIWCCLCFLSGWLPLLPVCLFVVVVVFYVQSIELSFKRKNALTNYFYYSDYIHSPFQLSVSENHGSIDSYAGWDIQSYRNFLTIPTRSSNNYYALEDINISGGTLQDQHVNILAAVRKVMSNLFAFGI